MPFVLSPVVLEPVLEVAARAPSRWNNQPWKVSLEGERLVIRPEASRHLPFLDAAVRELNVTLGGYVEAVRLSALAVGRRLELVEPPRDAFAALGEAGEVASDGAFASLLRQRQTSRLRYSPEEPTLGELQALKKAAHDAGCALQLFSKSSPDRAWLEGLLYAARREELLDPRAADETARFVRFDLRKVPDVGVSVFGMGLSDREVALWTALQPGPLRALSRVFAAPPLAGAAASAMVERFSESPFLGVLVADREVAQGGAAMLQLWLAATRLRLSLEPSAALLSRRGWPLAAKLGTEPARLAFAFRLGRSTPPPVTGRLRVRFS